MLLEELPGARALISSPNGSEPADLSGADAIGRPIGVVAPLVNAGENPPTPGSTGSFQAGSLNRSSTVVDVGAAPKAMLGGATGVGVSVGMLPKGSCCAVGGGPLNVVPDTDMPAMPLARPLEPCAAGLTMPKGSGGRGLADALAAAACAHACTMLQIQAILFVISRTMPPMGRVSMASRLRDLLPTAAPLVSATRISCSASSPPLLSSMRLTHSRTVLH